jgi:predicted RND superfamily exporter protein
VSGARWRAIVVLLGLLGVTAAVIVPGAARLRFDFTVNNLFLSDAEELATLTDTLERFGVDDRDSLIVLRAERGDWAQAVRLTQLDDLHRRIAAIPVEAEDLSSTEGAACDDPPGGAWYRVDGLTTAKVIRGGEGDARFVPIWPAADGASDAAMADTLRGDRLLQRRLINEALDVTLVRARLRCGLAEHARRTRYLAALRATAERWATDVGDVSLQFSGVPIIQDDVVTTLRSEFFRRQPATIIGMLVFLWLAFGRLRLAWLPFAATGMGALWWAGLMGIFGEPINVINLATVTVILVIGAGDGIHIISRYEEERREHPPDAALKRAFRHMVGACTLTTLTTLIGFLSLQVAEVEMIRQFGLWAAIGVAVTWLFTLLMIPALLLLFPPGLRAGDARGLGPIEGRLLPAIQRLVLRHYRAIAIGSLVLLVASAWGASHLKPRSRAMEELRSDHPAQLALTTLETELSGVLSFDIVLHGPRDRVLAPETLAAVAALQDSMTESPVGISSFSLVDLVSALHSLWQDGRQGERSDLPRDARKIAFWLTSLADTNDDQLSALLDDPQAEAERPGAAAGEPEGLDSEELGFGEDPEEALAALLSLPDDRPVALRIRCQKNDSGSDLFVAEMARIETHLSRLPAGVTGVITGPSTVANRAIDAIVNDMLESLLTAFVFIALAMAILLRSPWRALLAMVPNLLPLLLTMNAMLAMGMGIRITTVIIFAMCMGIVVDDTIHFLARFKEEERVHGDPELAMAETLIKAGRPALFTTTMLAFGFCLLISSEFNGLADFGSLSSLCIACALLADLLTLPSLLLWLRRR